MNGLVTELRRMCGHDSRSVDDCLTCAAANRIENIEAALNHAIEALLKIDIYSGDVSTPVKNSVRKSAIARRALACITIELALGAP